MPHIIFTDSRPLFTLFAALNHNGYDLEGNPAMHPVRLWLRSALADQPTSAYFAAAKPGWPRAGWLMSTLFCLDADYNWQRDPEPLWDDIAWESPEPLDAAARAWLRELPEQMRRWDTPALQALWDEALRRIKIEEPADVRTVIAARATESLTASPFTWDRDLIILPNYLQSDWSVDPVPLAGPLRIVVGPLSPRLAGGIVHEVAHETFGPLLTPLRAQLGQYVDILAPDRSLLERWGFWNPDPNHTVYKVVQECCVRAALAWLKGEGPDADWSNWGLNLAHAVYRRFERAGMLRDGDDVLAFLGEQASR